MHNKNFNFNILSKLHRHINVVIPITILIKCRNIFILTNTLYYLKSITKNYISKFLPVTVNVTNLVHTHENEIF